MSSSNRIQSTVPDSLLRTAIETFVRGVAFTRSFTHPYLAEQVGPLWVMRDGPRRRGAYRVEEWVGYDAPPTKIDRMAREHTRGRYCICALLGLDQDDAPMRDEFKALNYRLNSTEPLMVHDLKQIPRFDEPAALERVTTPETADRLTKAARKRQILPAHLVDDAPLRQYAALIEDELVGWVRSITTQTAGGASTWCADMYVKPEFRRRGIARSLMRRMLADDRAHGAERAVLLASHTGAKLYPVVGYVQMGTLYIYTPERK
ncbi:MAG: GNAT family N-acetyltransferase [Caldilineaceae bacterium]